MTRLDKVIAASAIATVLFVSDGLQLSGSLQALAQGQGGGNGGQNADNSGSVHAKENFNCQPSCISHIPNVVVGALIDYIGTSLSRAAKNTHGYTERYGLSGGSSGDDVGNDDGDTLGGNATAGGWGGEKT